MSKSLDWQTASRPEQVLKRTPHYRLLAKHSLLCTKLIACNVYTQVAQKVSQYQSRIKDTTRKTMALISELTMQQVHMCSTLSSGNRSTGVLQANALRLHQEVSEREAGVERAYMRLETGQPPDEATQQQWQQLLREEQLAPRKVRTACNNTERSESLDTQVCRA